MSAIADRTGKDCKRFRRIQVVRWEADAHSPQNLLQLISSRIEEPILVPCLAIITWLKRLKLQLDIFHGDAGRSRERLLALWIELAT